MISIKRSLRCLHNSTFSDQYMRSIRMWNNQTSLSETRECSWSSIVWQLKYYELQICKNTLSQSQRNEASFRNIIISTVMMNLTSHSRLSFEWLSSNFIHMFFSQSQLWCTLSTMQTHLNCIQSSCLKSSLWMRQLRSLSLMQSLL